jgi:hypothetical protein
MRNIKLSSVKGEADLWICGFRFMSHCVYIMPVYSVIDVFLLCIRV